MSIDINNINPSRADGLGRQDSAKGVAETRSPLGGSDTTSGTTDNVSLSTAAKDLAQIENDLKSLPEIDRSKVAEIKARFESGEYQVNSQNVAQKMLDLDS